MKNDLFKELPEQDCKKLQIAPFGLICWFRSAGGKFWLFPR
jgi:hypothetical protein